MTTPFTPATAELVNNAADYKDWYVWEADNLRAQWVITLDCYNRLFYGVLQTSEDDEAPFEYNRDLTPEEVTSSFATIFKPT